MIKVPSVDTHLIDSKAHAIEEEVSDLERLKEEASQLRRASDRLEEFERWDFVVAEEDSPFSDSYDVYAGYLDGVVTGLGTSSPHQLRLRMSLRNPAKVTLTDNAHIGGREAMD